MRRNNTGASRLTGRMTDETLIILDDYDVLDWCRHRRKIAELEQEHRNTNSGPDEGDVDYTTKWDAVIERIVARDDLGILGAVERYSFEGAHDSVLRCVASDDTEVVDVTKYMIRSGRERIARSSIDPVADSGPIDLDSVEVRVTPGNGLAIEADVRIRERIARSEPQ